MCKIIENGGSDFIFTILYFQKVFCTFRSSAPGLPPLIPVLIWHCARNFEFLSNHSLVLELKPKTIFTILQAHHLYIIFDSFTPSTSLALLITCTLLYNTTFNETIFSLLLNTHGLQQMSVSRIYFFSKLNSEFCGNYINENFIDELVRLISSHVKIIICC